MQSLCNRLLALIALCAVFVTPCPARQTKDLIPDPCAVVNCATQTSDLNVSGDYDNTIFIPVTLDGYDTSTGCVLDEVDFSQTVNESSLLQVENTNTNVTKTIRFLDDSTCGTAYQGLAGPAFYLSSSGGAVLSRLWVAVMAADYSPSTGYALSTYDGTMDYAGTSGVTFTRSSHYAGGTTTGFTDASTLAKFSHAHVRIYWQPQWINFIDTQLPTVVDQYGSCYNWANGGASTNSHAIVGGNLHATYHGH